jgi:hypothetical protein
MTRSQVAPPPWRGCWLETQAANWHVAVHSTRPLIYPRLVSAPKRSADAPQSLDHARHGGLPAAGSKCLPFFTDSACSSFQAYWPLSARALTTPDRGAGGEAQDAGEAAQNAREGARRGICAGWRPAMQGPRVSRGVRPSARLPPPAARAAPHTGPCAVKLHALFVRLTHACRPQQTARGRQRRTSPSPRSRYSS